VALRKGIFKGRQLYGALSVIKRLWPQAFLRDHLGWKSWKPDFESVQEVAGQPHEIGRIDRAISAEIDEDLRDEDPKYYAVLCMDGDDMGQWVSGVKTPALQSVLADKAWAYFADVWKPAQAAGLTADRIQRPLSPGYHAAFSEAVSNFGLYCAGQIVEEFEGQLIYSGGDELLAMLPAADALDCAYALQCAFRGQLPESAPQRVRDELERLFEFCADGFIRCRNSGKNEDLRANWPLLVPGPATTASVGIAIGHARSPMQDTIQAAREAEAAAKRVQKKGAFCLRVLKRSGEGVQFGARFGSGVFGVWAELEQATDQLSRRFPYRYIQLLGPLLTDSGAESDGGWVKSWDRSLIESVQAELRHTHFQQNESAHSAANKYERAWRQAERWIRSLVGEVHQFEDPGFTPTLTPRDFVHFWMAWAFVQRLDEPATPDNRAP
jgi:hypothetical protein